MLSEQEALNALKKLNSERIPKRIITYDGLYLILAPGPDPIEGRFDPFYSVDMETGETRGYSILQDGKGREIGALFEKAPDI